jgi:hypothetical protein
MFIECSVSIDSIHKSVAKKLNSSYHLALCVTLARIRSSCEPPFYLITLFKEVKEEIIISNNKSAITGVGWGSFILQTKETDSFQIENINRKQS